MASNDRALPPSEGPPPDPSGLPWEGLLPWETPPGEMSPTNTEGGASNLPEWLSDWPADTVLQTTPPVEELPAIQTPELTDLPVPEIAGVPVEELPDPLSLLPTGEMPEFILPGEGDLGTPIIPSRLLEQSIAVESVFESVAEVVVPTPEEIPVATAPEPVVAEVALPPSDPAPTWTEETKAEAARSKLLDELLGDNDARSTQPHFDRWGDATSRTVTASGERHLIFTLDRVEYAVPLGNVLEVSSPPQVTPLPCVPDWLLGLTNLRGDIISLVDMGMFLGLERSGRARSSRMLVAHTPSGAVTTGLLVDQVHGIRRLPIEQMGQPTAPLDDRVVPYLSGVCENDGRLLVVLDLNRLLQAPEMNQFQSV